MNAPNLTTLAFILAAFAMAPSIDAASVDEFNDGSTSPWTFNQLTTTSESAGAIRGTQTGGDPHLDRASFPNSALVESDGNQFVHIRLKKPATMNTLAQIFWATPPGGFNAPESATFSTTNDNTFQDYVIDLSGTTTWGDGLVGKIRVDHATAAGTGVFEMDYLRISSSATNSHEFVVDNFSNGDHSQWTKSGGIGSPSESGGLFSGTAINGDPFMFRDILDVDGTSGNYVRIGLAVTGSASNAQIFWANEDGGFAPARSATFPIISDGVMRTYEIDMRGDLDWAGKTIDAFRLDPTNVLGDSFQVDFIDIKSVPEPASIALFSVTGLVLFGFYHVRRRNRHNCRTNME